MNEARRRHAEALYRAGQAHDRRHPDRLERLRNLEPAAAELLGVLVRASRARRILEIGTSNGYSTIWLADAAQATGGTVVSVDTDAARSALAARQLGEIGLEPVVELRSEDGAVTLRRFGAAAWDFVFLDAERSEYPHYLPDLLGGLAPGGILAVDNVISHAHELEAFTAMIDGRQDLTQTVVAIGAGLRLAVRDD
jgi:predicted O-methyltransferase YrrM